MPKIRRKVVTKQARQGDVLITATEAPKGGAELPRESGRVVLAHGEVTGHAHAFTDPGVCRLRLEGAAYDLLQVTEGLVAPLQHEEHDAIRVGAGSYEIRLQQEWDYLAELARQVQD